MARVAGVEWKAVGASLDTLARTMREAPKASMQAKAFAASGVIQQAGVVLSARYIVPGAHMTTGPKGQPEYTSPPGATHGPIRRTWKDERGNSLRNSKGQFVQRVIESRLFVRGKFVDRSGGLQTAAKEIARTAPSERFPDDIGTWETRQRGKDGEIAAGVDAQARGYMEMRGGYRAAEVGSRRTNQRGVRGVWSSLRSVRGRWATLIRKRYPDLFALPKGGK